MAKLYRYRKVIDRYTTHSLVEPDYQLLERDAPEVVGVRIMELCEIDGWTYVSVPDAIPLPAQPEIIAATLESVNLSEQPALRDAIRAASPNCRAIKGRVVDRIRAAYSVDDEFKMLRLAPSEETAAYNDHVEACRAWGRGELEKLGV